MEEGGEVGSDDGVGNMIIFAESVTRKSEQRDPRGLLCRGLLAHWLLSRSPTTPNRLPSHPPTRRTTRRACVAARPAHIGTPVRPSLSPRLVLLGMRVCTHARMQRLINK